MALENGTPKCDDCGVVRSEDVDVRQTFCPYAQEINNSEVEVMLCDNCYHERCMDI